MKSALLLCSLIALLEFTLSSPIEPDEVFAEMLNYGRQRGRGLRRMRVGTNELRCYETYVIKINDLAERAGKELELCNTYAEAQRVVELKKAQKQRPELDERVQSIQNSLTACTAEKDIFNYVVCLMNGSHANQAALSEIKKISTDSFTYLNEGIDNIQLDKRECIDSLNRVAKYEIDNIVNGLENCLQQVKN